MLQNYNRYRVLGLFFDSPTKVFQLREMSRMLKMGLPSVINHVKALEAEGFVVAGKLGPYTGYAASNNSLFRLYKRNDTVLRLHETGLVSYLVDRYMPDAIVLFGSASRGEDVEESDIDILLVAKEEPVNLREFETGLKRNISLHFEPDTTKLPEELLNSIANGIVLYGYFRCK